MNAEEAGLALNAIELGMLAFGALFLYETFIKTDPLLGKSLQKLKDDYETGGCRTVLVDDPNAVGVAQEFATQAKAFSEAPDAVQWLAKFGGEFASSFKDGLFGDRTAADPNQILSAHKQDIEALGAEFQHIVDECKDWAADAGVQREQAAWADLRVVMHSNWLAGFYPVYNQSDIDTAIRTAGALPSAAADLASDAASEQRLLYSVPAPGTLSASQAAAVATLQTRARLSKGEIRAWTEYEDLESYSILTQFAGSKSTATYALATVYSLTGHNYGAATYEDGVADAKAKFAANAKQLISSSITKPGATYTAAYLLSALQAWQVPYNLLSRADQLSVANDILTFQNSTYGARFPSIPPQPLAS